MSQELLGSQPPQAAETSLISGDIQQHNRALIFGSPANREALYGEYRSQGLLEGPIRPGFGIMDPEGRIIPSGDLTHHEDIIRRMYGLDGAHPPTDIQEQIDTKYYGQPTLWFLDQGGIIIHDVMIKFNPKVVDQRKMTTALAFSLEGTKHLDKPPLNILLGYRYPDTTGEVDCSVLYERASVEASGYDITRVPPTWYDTLIHDTATDTFHSGRLRLPEELWNMSDQTLVTAADGWLRSLGPDAREQAMSATIGKLREEFAQKEQASRLAAEEIVHASESALYDPVLAALWDVHNSLLSVEGNPMKPGQLEGYQKTLLEGIRKANDPDRHGELTDRGVPLSGDIVRAWDTAAHQLAALSGDPTQVAEMIRARETMILQGMNEWKEPFERYMDQRTPILEAITAARITRLNEYRATLEALVAADREGAHQMIESFRGVFAALEPVLTHLKDTFAPLEARYRNYAGPDVRGVDDPIYHQGFYRPLKTCMDGIVQLQGILEDQQRTPLENLMAGQQLAGMLRGDIAGVPSLMELELLFGQFDIANDMLAALVQAEDARHDPIEQGLANAYYREQADTAFVKEVARRLAEDMITAKEAQALLGDRSPRDMRLITAGGRSLADLLQGPPEPIDEMMQDQAGRGHTQHGLLMNTALLFIYGAITAKHAVFGDAQPPSDDADSVRAKGLPSADAPPEESKKRPGLISRMNAIAAMFGAIPRFAEGTHEELVRRGEGEAAARQANAKKRAGKWEQWMADAQSWAEYYEAHAAELAEQQRITREAYDAYHRAFRDRNRVSPPEPPQRPAQAPMLPGAPAGRSPGIRSSQLLGAALALHDLTSRLGHLSQAIRPPEQQPSYTTSLTGDYTNPEEVLVPGVPQVQDNGGGSGIPNSDFFDDTGYLNPPGTQTGIDKNAPERMDFRDHPEFLAFAGHFPTQAAAESAWWEMMQPRHVQEANERRNVLIGAGLFMGSEGLPPLDHTSRRPNFGIRK